MRSIINYFTVLLIIIKNVVNINGNQENDLLQSNNTIKFNFLMDDVIGVTNSKDNIDSSLLVISDIGNFGGNYSDSPTNAPSTKIPNTTSTLSPTNMPTTDMPTNMPSTDVITNIPSISMMPPNIPTTSPSDNTNMVPTITLQPSKTPTISIHPSKTPTNGKYSHLCNTYEIS